MKKLLAFALAASVWSCVPAPAGAVEIDFATKLVDLDGKPYRDCVKPNVTKTECDEWIEHTLGLIAYSALDRAEQGTNVLEQAKRAVLARMVYPGKNTTHVVDVSAAEITLMVEQIGKLGLRPVEVMRVIELLDPARLKK